MEIRDIEESNEMQNIQKVLNEVRRKAKRLDDEECGDVIEELVEAIEYVAYEVMYWAAWRF